MITLLIGLVITLLIVGVVYWVVMKLLGTVGEMPPIVPVAIQIIFVLIVVAVLVNFLGHFGGGASFTGWRLC